MIPGTERGAISPIRSTFHWLAQCRRSGGIGDRSIGRMESQRDAEFRPRWQVHCRKYVTDLDGQLRVNGEAERERLENGVMKLINNRSNMD